MCKLKHLNAIIVVLDSLASAYLLLSVPAAARTKTFQVQNEEEEVFTSLPKEDFKLGLLDQKCHTLNPLRYSRRVSTVKSGHALLISIANTEK